MSRSARVNPNRFSYTVSWTIDSPLAWVRATTSGCCQSVMKPGWTAVSSTSELRSPPGWENRMPSSSMSSAPPTLRKTLRNVIISSCRAPLTVMSPPVARAAHAQLAASIRSGRARWV